MKRFFSFVVVAFASLTLFIACGDDVGADGELVGGACRDSRDCEGDCEGGGDFPEGMCTIRCSDSRDCPEGTWCIDKKGGVCALSCRENADCRRGYVCKSQDLKGDRGEEFICIGD